MSRRLLPLLTALFLLLSQQVAQTHVYAHVGAARQAQALARPASQQTAVVFEANVVEQLCAMCLAAADVAFAVPGTMYRFDLAAAKLQQLILLYTQPRERSTRVVFLTRAPPFA